MLVLSRKENQRILFPNLGIAIQVVRLAGNVVRLGVEAPSDVEILREEIAEKRGISTDMAEASRRRRHELRNHLNTANLALNLVQQQLERGMTEDADRTLQHAIHELMRIDTMVTGADSTKEAAVNQETPADHAPPRRALLVEDNDNERELLAAYLRLNGYQVDVVRDGLEAIDYLSTHSPPDVVLLDMQMPRLDGQGTITAIRCNPLFRGVKVVAVSGTDPRGMNIPLGGRGVDRWFAKPINPPAFIESLNGELGQG